MSADITLSASDLRFLATALEGLTKIRRETGVSVSPFAPASISIDDGPSIEVTWVESDEQYVIDESIGR